LGLIQLGDLLLGPRLHPRLFQGRRRSPSVTKFCHAATSELQEVKRGRHFPDRRPRIGNPGLPRRRRGLVILSRGGRPERRVQRCYRLLTVHSRVSLTGASPRSYARGAVIVSPASSTVTTRPVMASTWRVIILACASCPNVKVQIGVAPSRAPGSPQYRTRPRRSAPLPAPGAGEERSGFLGSSRPTSLRLTGVRSTSTILLTVLTVRLREVPDVAGPSPRTALPNPARQNAENHTCRLLVLESPLLITPTRMVRTLVRIIALWALGAGLFIFHGIGFHLTPWSQAIINAIVKYKYPDTGQEDTTVLLFTEENLAELGGSFPVPYELHAQVLEKLSPPHQPRAVLVDFGFVAPASPEAIKRLSKAICTLTRRSDLTGRTVDVYLVLPPLPEHPSAEQRRASEIQSALLNPKFLPSFLKGTSDFDPPGCAIPVTAQMEAEYGVSGVLEYKDSGKTLLDCTDLRTDTCMDLRADSRQPFTPTPAFAMLPPDRKEPMEIIWGNGVAPLNKYWFCVEQPRVQQPRTALARLKEGFARLTGRVAPLFQALREGPLSHKQLCPYTRTISVGHLLNSDPVDPDPDVTGAIDGKTVFYGGGFLMASDVVVSPVFGELPAVYLHAMAYDNLRTFGANYKRADRAFLSRSGAIDDVLLLLIAALLVLVSTDKLPRLPRPRPLFRWLALGLAAGWLLHAWRFRGLLVPQTSWDTLYSAVLLIPPMFLIGAFAALDPATALPASGFWGARAALMRQRRAEFRLRCLLTLISVPLSVLTVLAVDVWLGFQAAVLVALLCYFLYKLLVAKDAPFVVMAVLLGVASAISWLLNVGPRNIVAYLLFFEVARHVVTHLDHIAAEYFQLRDRPHAFWDVVFRVCLRNQDEEARHADPVGGWGGAMGVTRSGAERHLGGGQVGDGDEDSRKHGMAVRLRESDQADAAPQRGRWRSSPAGPGPGFPVSPAHREERGIPVREGICGGDGSTHPHPQSGMRSTRGEPGVRGGPQRG
jgi:CHASE2 domain-containing protein